MKKSVKIVLSIVGIVLVVGIVGFINMGLPMMSMEPVESQEIVPGTIFAVKNKNNNFYILKDGQATIAVDIRMGDEQSAEEIKKLGIQPEDFDTILLTHTDFDHVEGIERFANASVYISEQEVQMIDGTTSRGLFQENKLPEGTGYTALKDGELLHIGDFTIKCILTPGHTPGSMSYLINDVYLFTGDTFRIKDGKALTHPFTMDKEAQKESIASLQGLDSVSYVFTSHYGYTRNFTGLFQ